MKIIQIGLITEVISSSSYTAVAGRIYSCNGVATVYLPTGKLGDTIGFCDHLGSSQTSPTGFGLNPMTIHGPIQEETSLTLAGDMESVLLKFDGTKWLIAASNFTI